jgi:hypothetical protein
MSLLKTRGFELARGWFNSDVITSLTADLDSYSKKFANSEFIPFDQEVSKGLLAKDKSQTRQLFIDKTHKEAFFIKTENSYKLVNLMDPHNYISKVLDIISNRYLNEYINSVDTKYRFKNSIFFFKNKQDNNIIDWHRDSSRSEVNKLILGVYLEDSIEGVDAVKYLPGSHLEDDVVINESKAVEVPAKRGDCVIHYGSVFHMSPVCNRDKVRRTLYLKYNLTN